MHKPPRQHLAADFLDAYTFVAVGRVGGAAQTVGAPGLHMHMPATAPQISSPTSFRWSSG